MTTVRAFADELTDALPRLRRAAMTMTRDREAALDLLQDTVERALRAQESFAPGTNFVGWAYTIMRNRWISSIRRQRSMTPLDDPTVMSIGCQASQGDNLALREMEFALASLSAEHRDAVLLCAAGHRLEDIAARTGCTVGTVKSRVSRARDRLRGFVDRGFEGSPA